MAGPTNNRPDRTVRQIQQTRQDLTYIARWLPAALATLDLLADPLRGTDYDQTNTPGIGDPVPGLAHVHGPWIARLADIRAVAAILEAQARLLAQHVAAVPVTDDERDRREFQCSGGLHRLDYEGWERHCEANWLRRTGMNAFLCSNCIRKQDRWRKERDELAIA